MMNSRISTQLLSVIEGRNIDQFSIALPIALAQQPPIDLNQILQNGHTFLTFAALHYNASIITKLVREPSVNVNQVNAFNLTFMQIASQLGITDDTLKSLLRTADRSVSPPISHRQNAEKRQNPPLQYASKYCEKTFQLRSNLERHILTHTGVRTFKCDVCDRTFNRSSHLRRHFLIHTGERPFKCDVCDRTFAQRCNLVAHKRIHTNERPFKCEECGKKFKQGSHLKKHKISVHSDQNSHKCQTCGKTFKQRKTLIGHQRRHTEEDHQEVELALRENRRLANEILTKFDS